jgi:hypothetical protein
MNEDWLNEDRQDHDAINAELRRAAGFEPTDSDETPDETLRALIAARAGLDPTVWAPRLRGDSPQELADDAHRIAAAVDEAREVDEAHGEGEASRSGGFDGGARRSRSRSPTFESVVRAEIEARRFNVGQRARSIDLERIWKQRAEKGDAE